MLTTFLGHQWKEFWRSRNKGGSIATQIFIGFFILYFLSLAIGAGIFMKQLLAEVFHGVSVITAFNGVILYYFGLEILSRLQLQELPTLSIIPYLHLKIPKRKIIRFLNTMAMINFFNFLPLFLFLPFCFGPILSNFGIFGCLAYVVAILSLMLFNNFIVLYIKRKSLTSISYSLVFLLVIGALAALEYFHIISLRAGSDFVFSAIGAKPYLTFSFIIAAGAIFFINSNFLKSNLYVEELSKKQEKKVSTDYSFLNRFGKVGQLAALEFKLIIRHKRSKSAVLMGFFFLFYGFLFYKQGPLAQNAFSKMLFGGIFITGYSVIGYGQFMHAWQSAHFDGLLTNKIDFKDYIKSKFLLLYIVCTFFTILSSFYGFVDPKLLLLHLCAYLYNIGFSTVLTLFLANYNYKRMDITKSASFSFQGAGARQWILMFPFLILPYLIYAPFGAFNKPFLGLIVIGLFGLVMLLTRNFWINLIVKKLEQNRYTIAEGFRE